MFRKQIQGCQSLATRELRINRLSQSPVRRCEFSNSYKNENNKKSLRGIVPLLFASSLYLYFQEDILSSLIAPIQKELLHYKGVVETNKNVHEMEESKKKVYESFDPELSMQYYWKKLERKLDDKWRIAFEKILSALAQEEIKSIKKNNLQTITTHNKDKRTLEAFEVARVWKIEEGPVIYFHKGNYSGGKKFRLFNEYGFENEDALRNTLKAMSTQKPENINFWRSISQYWMTRAAQENVEEPIITSKSLLIILDDAETFMESQEKGNEGVIKFLNEVKILLKEDLAKVLILCNDKETKSKAVRIFDQDFVSHSESTIRSSQTAQDFLEYVTNFTGLNTEKAKRFVDVFGFDIFSLVDLQKFMQENSVLNNNKNGLNNNDLMNDYLKKFSNISEKEDLSN